MVETEQNCSPYGKERERGAGAETQARHSFKDTSPILLHFLGLWENTMAEVT